MNGMKISIRTVIGIIVLALGVLLMLGSLKIIDASEIFSKGWPLILIVIGLMSLLNQSSNKIFGILMIALGVFYQLKVLGIFFEDVNIWQLIWPVALIVVGLFLIVPKRPHIVNADSITNSATAIFSGTDVNVNSQQFIGGEATALFGGVEIDLTGADMDPNNPPVIDLFVAFGGIDIKVPEDWYVETKGLIILGGAGNKKKELGNQEVEVLPKKVLTVKYFGMFGGMDIE